MVARSTEEGQGRSLTLPPLNYVLDIEKRLASQLGTKVSIETRRNGQRGRIIIEFYSR